MLSGETEDWIWECNPDGRITSASEQVQEILGYSPAEMRGKVFVDLLAPGDTARIAPELILVIEKRGVPVF